MRAAAAAAAAAAGAVALAGATGRGAAAGCAEEPDRLAEWRKRWEIGQTGWQLDEVNPYLLRFLDELLPEAPPADWVNTMGPRVLVPLCGKTLDMAFLATRGCRVVGFEGVGKAIQDFAARHGQGEGLEPLLLPEEIDPRQFQAHAVVVRADPGACELPPPVVLVEGDFLAVGPAEAEAFVPFQAALDRGSLVAIRPSDRPRYARVLADLVAPGGRVLLVAVEHDAFADGRLGPPFEVTEADVRALYEDKFEVQLLLREDRLDKDAGMRARGLTRFHECAYLLTRRGGHEH